jgi:Ca2+-binding EF-hand superfamily protein
VHPSKRPDTEQFSEFLRRIDTDGDGRVPVDAIREIIRDITLGEDEE